MLANLLNNLRQWFSDRRERDELILTWNYKAKNSFINGVVPVLMKAQKSKGNPEWKHQFSKLHHGFRIIVLSGTQLSRQEIVAIGETVISDNSLVRRLVVLGFDTL